MLLSCCSRARRGISICGIAKAPPGGTFGWSEELLDIVCESIGVTIGRVRYGVVTAAGDGECNEIENNV